MTNRLQASENMIKAMDGDSPLQPFGYESKSESVAHDLKWLIEQAEKVERYEKALKDIQKCADFEELVQEICEKSLRRNDR